MKVLSHPLLHRVLGIALGAVFLYASLDKIAQPAKFARIVYHYQVIGPSQNVPPLVPNVFAVVLPWVEVPLVAMIPPWIVTWSMLALKGLASLSVAVPVLTS